MGGGCNFYQQIVQSKPPPSSCGVLFYDYQWNVKLITSPQEASNSFSLWPVRDFLLIIFKLSSLQSLVRSHYSIHASGNYPPKDVPLPLWICSHDKLKTSTDWRLYVVQHSLQLQSFNIIQVWFTGVGGNNRTKHPGQYTNMDRYQPVIYKMNKHEPYHHREYTVLNPLLYPHMWYQHMLPLAFA